MGHGRPRRMFHVEQPAGGPGGGRSRSRGAPWGPSIAFARAVRELHGAGCARPGGRHVRIPARNPPVCRTGSTWNITPRPFPSPATSGEPVVTRPHARTSCGARTVSGEDGVWLAAPAAAGWCGRPAEEQPEPTPGASEPHRHHDVAGVERPRRVDQAAAVGVRQPDLDLVALDRAQRIQQVVDVEADLDFLALIATPRPGPPLPPAPDCAPGW